MNRLFLLLTLLLTFSCSTPDQATFTNELKTGSTKGPESKTIVMIHGMFLTAESWTDWKKYFEAAGYKVYAPAWAEHEQSAKELRAKNPDVKLAALTLEATVARYEEFIKKLPEKPILIGHSMGGLIVQILLQKHLGVAGVAIDSAPPKGTISLRYSFLKANWGVISPFADEDETLNLTRDQFQYAFTNCLNDSAAKQAYDQYAVPESRRLGKGALNDIAAIDYDKKTLPLLMLAGGEDHIIPASLNYANFKKYSDAPSLTEFKLYENRCHWTVGQEGWQDVATFVKEWLNKVKA